MQISERKLFATAYDCSPLRIATNTVSQAMKSRHCAECGTSWSWKVRIMPTLDSSVFDLSVLFCTHGGRAHSRSAIIHFSAVFGIDYYKGCYRLPPTCGQILGLVIYYARFLLSEYALPTAGHEHIDGPYNLLLHNHLPLSKICATFDLSTNRTDTCSPRSFYCLSPPDTFLCFRDCPTMANLAHCNKEFDHTADLFEGHFHRHPLELAWWWVKMVDLQATPSQLNPPDQLVQVPPPVASSW